MDVACTLVCPKANQEVIITHPDGNETQKCEKCEGDCPKGGGHCIIEDTFAFVHNIKHSLATLLGSPVHLLIIANI